MKIKKWISVLLVLSMVLGMRVISTASEKVTGEEVNPIIQQMAVELLERGYAEGYEFSDSTATLCCNHEENGVVEVCFLLEISATLKAKSVQELDYFKGIMEFCENQCVVEMNTQISDLNVMQYEDKKIEEMYENLSQYIGVEQVFPFYVRATYNKDDLENATILYESGLEYVEAEQLYPQSGDELKENGYSYMKSESEMMISRLSSEESEINATAQNYSVFNAVMYSETYTSNPTTCSFHGNTCGNYVNTEKYNSAYANYASTHTDCANFVSQIACAGGIPTDSNWKAGTSKWYNVANLCSYMVEKGYWKEISFSELAVGDFVSFTPESHIALVSAFDGENFRYSAHTNDRLNYAFRDVSTYTYYRVIY